MVIEFIRMHAHTHLIVVKFTAYPIRKKFSKKIREYEHLFIGTTKQ